ncbi:hypothetical protein GCM10025873_05730 [Demequina sediminis]|uniref:hypothetical protein n=1 Tax=Demequina sediminis TaxID=1930058 RepID=UPI0025730878|nr:hypothetical protein [Demequina sediminis]BDZ60782.1 hypothetical protein GCM10025873_05730 [Demequina sediminis]
MANPERPVSEYDRFGPWIDRVETEADVPRLFRPHGVDLAAARLVLKVPRNVARRDASPDMDLYDHLLVLGRDSLTVLSRRGRDLPRGAQPGAGAATTMRTSRSRGSSRCGTRSICSRGGCPSPRTMAES